jgi:hypothetical protein
MTMRFKGKKQADGTGPGQDPSQPIPTTTTT